MVYRSTILAVLIALATACGTVGTKTGIFTDTLVIAKQGSFFIGGAAREAEPLSGVDYTSLGSAQAGTLTTGQMYVRYQIPVNSSHLPVVMIHGGGLSGQVYETTPDGRMGWSEYFVRAGRPVYAIDQVGRGRSGFDGTAFNAVRLGERLPKEQASMSHVGHEYAWIHFRIGPQVGIPFPDTQFPIDALDAFYKIWIPDLTASISSMNRNYANLAALGKRVGGAILIGHSQSFMFPQRAALVDPTAVKGIISLESSDACATPFTQQERATLAKIPMLIVFADHLADVPEPFGSRWTISMAQCQAFAAAIREEGGDVTFLHLPEIGIRGNTHMIMLDRNSLTIADHLINWIDRHVKHPAK